MSHRTTGRIVGSLFLAAFVCYGVGGTLVGSLTGDGDLLGRVAAHPVRLESGALLMLLNSLVVTGIAVLAYGVLKDSNPVTASAYLVARVFEATVLAIGVVFLLMLVPLSESAAPGTSALAETLTAGNDVAFQVAMIGLGAGSLMFCRALLSQRLVPRFLAIWGIAGYAIFATGAVLELFGFGVGVLLAIPGGLFEVALGVTLLRSGFAEPQHVTTHHHTDQPRGATS